MNWAHLQVIKYIVKIMSIITLWIDINLVNFLSDKSWSQLSHLVYQLI